MALAFYIVVFLSSLVLFSLKWTAPTGGVELFIKIIGKLVPLFLMLISLIQVLAMYGFLEKPLF